MAASLNLSLQLCQLPAFQAVLWITYYPVLLLQNSKGNFLRMVNEFLKIRNNMPFTSKKNELFLFL